jgi:hypothetical protein
MLALIAASIATAGFVLVSRRGRRRRLSGFASPTEVREHLADSALRSKAAQVRPGLSARRVAPTELGLSLGREAASRRRLWASLEDSSSFSGRPGPAKA